ncbi:MAG: hypothetical protein ACREDP_21000, partial [Bradyrhizobium sp.]
SNTMPNTPVQAAGSGLPSLSRRQSFLAATSIVAAAMVPAALWPADASANFAPAFTDPIFARIEAHRVALAAVNHSPLDIAEDDFEELLDAEHEHRDQLHTVVPTTAAGLLALIDHIVTKAAEFGAWDPRSNEPADCDAGSLLATVSAFLKTTAGV